MHVGIMGGGEYMCVCVFWRIICGNIFLFGCDMMLNYVSRELWKLLILFILTKLLVCKMVRFGKGSKC